MHRLTIQTHRKREILDITDRVEGLLGSVNTNRYFRGILFLWRSHKRSTFA